MTPAEADDHVAIMATMGAYHVAVDDGDIAGLAATFAEDGSLEVSNGSIFAGRREIFDALTKRRAEREAGQAEAIFQRHHLTTRRIALGGADEARCVSYFLVTTELGLDHSGRYVDRFVRVGTDWLIASRRVEVDWRHPRSRFAIHRRKD